MTLAIAIENRLEREIARTLQIMGRVRDRPEGLNETDTKVTFIDPFLSALGWARLDRFSVSEQYRSPSSEHPRVFASGVFVHPVRSS